MTDAFLLSWSLRENLRPRRMFVWLIVAGAIFAITKSLRTFNSTQPVVETYVLLSSLVVYKLVALVAAIFAMGVVATEVEQKTIVYLLTRPIARFRILLWRTVGAMVAVAVIGMLTTFAVSLATYGFRSHPLLSNDLVANVLGGCAYTGLFVFVSLLVNRAMAYCLVFAFGWETAVPNMQGDVGWLSLNAFMQAIGQHPKQKSESGGLNILNAFAGLTDSTPIAPATGAIVLLIVTAVTLVIGMIWFSRFEYVPREDGE